MVEPVDPAQVRLPHVGDEIEPNPEQRRLIGTIDGTVLVDAGAGTGKTFTIAHRYLHLLDERDLDPRDVLLITFTNNAAEEMRERILRLGRPTVRPAQLRDAPISTFHALAKRLLERDGFEAPVHLGLDGRLAPNVQLVENEVLEAELFEDFLRGFRDAHPEHADQFRALYDPTNLLDLVKQLAAKGVFPTADGGWYRSGGEDLDGDRAALLETFEEANATDGSTQSDLRSALSDYKDKVVLPSAPAREELRGAYGTKQVDPEWGRRAFDEDREALRAFVHDVYVEYLEYVLDRNVLNFPFLLLFAYVLLVEDDELRERLQYEYVMIDEFQDTSEIQFKLALLFCAEPNLCCVGDWKQSIYSFQHASVDNILDFSSRVRRYADRLNDDVQRVPPADAFADDLVEIELVENYRSTQRILDTASRALVAPATKSDDVADRAAEIRERIVDLSSNARLERSRVEAFTADDEVDLVLDRLQAIVDNDGYALVDDEATTDERVATRAPDWGDVAVLTRTRAFALRLQERARELGVPVAFEGGVEVYRTDPGKLLLAWLRILEDPHAERGWAVVLEKAGYTLGQAQAVLDEGRYPEQMWAFRRRLDRLPSIGARARAVFDRYGLRDGFTESLVASLQSAFEATKRTPAEMVRFLEDNLEAGTTEPIDDHPGGEVVTVQTIHAAKGLEYPIVVLADVNEHRFPSSSGGRPTAIEMRDPIGLRAAKVYAEPDDGPPYVYDNWCHVLLRRCLSSADHDEERRLFYVAASRAEQHLVATAQTNRASRFFEHLPVEADEVEPAPQPVDADEAERPPELSVDVPEASAPRAIPVGALVDEPDVTGGRGRRFGQRLHAFAARYALGRPVEPSNGDEAHVAGTVDELAARGHVKPEVPCRLLVQAGGIEHVIEGKIDLLAVDEDRVDVVDWKTAPPGAGLAAYATQVGLYAHVVERAHPDKEVRGWVVYTEDGSRQAVEPIDADRVRDLLTGC